MSHVPNLRRQALASTALLLLAACGSTSQSGADQAEQEQTKLDIALVADDDVNPDDQGRAAPILVRVYELKATGNFSNADYFSLHNNDKKVLEADMLARDEFIMRPGAKEVLRRKSRPGTRAIGVVAGYRDLPNSEWRAIHKLAAAPEPAWYRALLSDSKLRLLVRLQAKGTTVSVLP